MAKYRISFLTGLATGFVLGARAGRERYEQIVKAAKTVAEHPAVQQAAGAVQAQATGLAATAGSRISGEVRDRVPQLAKTAKSATEKVADRVPGLRGHVGNGHAGNGHAGNGHEPGSGSGSGEFTAMGDRDTTS